MGRQVDRQQMLQQHVASIHASCSSNIRCEFCNWGPTCGASHIGACRTDSFITSRMVSSCRRPFVVVVVVVLAARFWRSSWSVQRRPLPCNIKTSEQRFELRVLRSSSACCVLGHSLEQQFEGTEPSSLGQLYSPPINN